MSAIEMPFSIGFTTREFQPAYRQQMSPSGSGNLQVIQRSIPLWRAQYTTPPLLGSKFDDFNQFLDAMDQSMGTFLAYDPMRLMPRAYQNLSTIADPWTAAGQSSPIITASSWTNSTLTIGRLAPGAIISVGDYVCCFDGIAWYLFRSQTAITVTSSGSATIAVKPRPVDSLGNSNYAVRYRRAVCEMKIIGEVKETGSVGTGQTFNFKAAQYIRKATS